jgi:hypothetical protein
VGCGFLSRFIGSISGGVKSLITLPITSHELATSSGSSSAPSWRKPPLWSFRDELLVMNCYGELLIQTPMTKLLGRAPFTDCPDELLRPDSFGETPMTNCSGELRCLVATIPHCFGCRGYFVYRTAGSTLVVSADT